MRGWVVVCENREGLCVKKRTVARESFSASADPVRNLDLAIGAAGISARRKNPCRAEAVRYAWAQMLRACCFLVGLFLVGKGLLVAAPEVVKREVPAGVEVAALDPATIAKSEADARERDNDYLLLDSQVDVAAETDYTRVALRVAGEGGLQEAGRWSVSFDPEYQEVWFHRIEVHRGGEVHDRLAEAEFRYLEQEPDSAYHLYSGEVTALTLLPDLRVGDVVDVAYTIKGRNPVFAGRYFDSFSLGWGQPLAMLRAQVKAPTTLPLRFKVLGEGISSPELGIAGDQQVITWRAEDLPAVLFEDGTPSWYPTYPWAQFSEYASWAEVVAWALPLYAEGFGEPGAELQAEVDALLAPLGDDAAAEDVAVALLAFVQREIRYLGIELGVSSHRPHPPAETYARRFGDCKDKAVLLVQLLRSRGITAHPVLVNTVVGEALRERLPSPGVFDHVIVGLEVGDGLRWVDPTMSPGKGGLLQRAAPDYGWGLMLAEGEDGLRRVDQPPEAASRTESTEVYTSFGFEQPGSLHVSSVYYGAAAISIRDYFNSSTPEQIGQTYQDYYAGLFPEIAITAPPTWRDREDGAVEVAEDYTVPGLWTHDEESGRWTLETYPLLMDSYLPYGLSAKRRTPRSVSHAVTVKLRQELRLHEPWGLDLPAVDIDLPIFSYSRRAEGDGTATLTVEHHYESKVSHVAAAAMPAYVQAVNSARDAFGLELYWNPVVATGAAGDGEFSPNLLMFVIGIGGFFAFNALIFWWVRHRHRQPPSLPNPGAEPVGLGGWLVLPAIGLVVSPIIFTVSLFGESAAAFDHEVWAALTTPGLETTNVPLAVLILVEVLADAALISLSLWCLVMFFRCDRVLPTLMRVYIVYALLYTIGDTVGLDVMDLFDDEVERVTAHAEIFRQAIYTAVWLPYFCVSKRVRNTFVR